MYEMMIELEYVENNKQIFNETIQTNELIWRHFFHCRIK